MMSLAWLFRRMEEWNGKEALVWKDRSFTYKDILERKNYWKNRLEKLGIKPGSTVCLEGDYSFNVCSLLLALIQHGTIVVPLTRAVREKRKEYLETAEVQFVFGFDQEDMPSIARTDTKITHPLILQLAREKTPGLILFSSGSTGKNKAVLHDFSKLLEKFKVRRQSMRTLNFLLFDHIGGINTFFYTLSNGGTVITSLDRSPENVCQLIEKYRVELLPTTPSFLNLLLISGALKDHDLSSLKLITYGTEVMPESLLKRVREAFPRVRLLQTYGLSEVGILRSKSKDSDNLWVKVGGEGFQTKIVDGTLWIKADSAMMGYLNAPNPFDEDGWINTGDVVEQNGEYIRILGRKSDIINVGGQKVYPAEVEGVLLEMDNVLEATVRGEKNPLVGNIVVAKLTLKQPENPLQLKRRIRNFCRNRLESYKSPVKIEIEEKPRYTKRFKKQRM